MSLSGFDVRESLRAAGRLAVIALIAALIIFLIRLGSVVSPAPSLRGGYNFQDGGPIDNGDLHNAAPHPAAPQAAARHP